MIRKVRYLTLARSYHTYILHVIQRIISALALVRDETQSGTRQGTDQSLCNKYKKYDGLE